MSPLHLPSRRAALLASSAALATLAGGTAVYAAGEKTVQLSVDGQPRTVELRGDTVADVLTAAGVTAGPHDVLAPAAERPVDDGDAVALRRGRELRLVVDGAARSVWVTADDVGEALDQVGLLASGAALSASRSRAIGLDGLSLQVRLPKTLRVLVDGKSLTRTTTAATVKDALTEARVTLGAKDRVSVPLTAAVTDGAAVRVTRMAARTVVEERSLPFPTVRRADDSRYRGTERVTTAGRKGTERLTYSLTYVDGKPAGKRTLVSTVRTVAPVARVVSFGTKSRPEPVAPVVQSPAPSRPSTSASRPAAASRPSTSSRSTAAPRPAPAAPTPTPTRSSTPAPSSGGSSGGLNWAALARCESGGDPRAASANGLYFGLYQFDVGTWRSIGGSGLPSQASAAEQTARAQALYNSRGRSPWPTCGRYL